MGFFSSTTTFCRYRVEEAPPPIFWNWAVEAIGARIFREGENLVEESSVGWACSRDPFQETISINDICYGDYLLVSVRIDERKVPAAALKKYCAAEEKQIMEEKNMKRIPRKMKQEIKERVRIRLLQKVLPVPKVYDLCWNVSSGLVFLFSCQEKAQALAEDLFYKTFAMRLSPIIPFTCAVQQLEGSDRQELLGQLRPEILI